MRSSDSYTCAVRKRCSGAGSGSWKPNAAACSHAVVWAFASSRVLPARNELNRYSALLDREFFVTCPPEQRRRSWWPKNEARDSREGADLLRLRALKPFHPGSAT